MFADLLLEEIQPREIDVKNIPDIELTESLEYDLQKMLEEEEGSFSKVSDKTSVVQTDKNYVFFSMAIFGCFVQKICGVIKTVW